MDRLKDKVALVTGSSRGIGAAISALFAREGAKLALHGRDVGALSAVLADIVQAGGEAIDVAADVTKFSDIEAMRRRIEREFGPLDILIANAGGSFTTPGSIEQTSEEEWRALLLKRAYPQVSEKISSNCIRSSVSAHPRMSHRRRSISLPMMQRGSRALPWMSLAGRSWSKRHAALSAPSSANGEHVLWLAHAPQRVPTHRQQLISHSLRGLHERLGNQDWRPQLFAQSFQAGRLIHSGTDNREVEAVGGAYVAVGVFAGVQRNVQDERRIAGRRLSGVERLGPRPQNPSNSGSAATSLVPASISQACRGMRSVSRSEFGMR